MQRAIFLLTLFWCIFDHFEIDKLQQLLILSRKLRCRIFYAKPLPRCKMRSYSNSSSTVGFVHRATNFLDFQGKRGERKREFYSENMLIDSSNSSVLFMADTIFSFFSFLTIECPTAAAAVASGFWGNWIECVSLYSSLLPKRLMKLSFVLCTAVIGVTNAVLLVKVARIRKEDTCNYNTLLIRLMQTKRCGQNLQYILLHAVCAVPLLPRVLVTNLKR